MPNFEEIDPKLKEEISKVGIKEKIEKARERMEKEGKPEKADDGAIYKLGKKIREQKPKEIAKKIIDKTKEGIDKFDNVIDKIKTKLKKRREEKIEQARQYTRRYYEKDREERAKKILDQYAPPEVRAAQERSRRKFEEEAEKRKDAKELKEKF